MKIILSHDVDHLRWSEHYLKDLFIPKLWIRTFLQRVKNQIDTKTAWNRCNIFMNKELHRLYDLVDYLKKENIKSTFFLGFANGLNLSYSNAQARIWGNWLIDKGFHVGVHGICFDSAEGIKKEFDKAQSLLEHSNFKGIRMHYLRHNENSAKYWKEAGYAFDSSEYKVENPYLILPDFWSFPIGVMDTYAVSAIEQDLDKAKAYTFERLALAKEKKLDYFVINFHDTYFDSDAYGLYKDWLVWIIDYLKGEGYLFTDFQSALKELNSAH